MWKQCTKCGKHKALWEFSKRNNGMFGLNSVCKDCKNTGDWRQFTRNTVDNISNCIINKIINMYVSEELSLEVISNTITCSSAVIRKVLVNNNIKIRERGETFIGKKKNYEVKGCFEKGHIPWNKDTKGVMKSNSMSFKKGQIPWNKGLVNINSTIREQIRGRQEFKNWRYAVYKRDNNTCQLCGRKQNSKLTVNAHHVYRLNDIIQDYNITTLNEAYSCNILWDINNGVVLCEDCHKKTHKGVMPSENQY